MSYHVVIPVLVSFALSLVLGPIVIPFLRKLKMGQTEREEGVQSHLKKAGTPTMGGIIISGQCRYHVPVLCKRLSESDSDPVSDAWFWSDWISG